jgi:aminopeptidase
MAAGITDERLELYAELAVRVGANVQEGQEVFLYTSPEHADVARALTRQCYRAGATYVNARFDDAHVKHAMIGLGPDSALTYSPEWTQQFARDMAGNALLATTGTPEPELLADLDGDRVGRAMQVEVAKIRRQQHHDNTVNWCGVGAPNEGWAQQVFGEPDVERLWELVATCFRLDEDDPVTAWQEHLARVSRPARRRSPT